MSTPTIEPGCLVRINDVIWQVDCVETDEDGKRYIVADAPQIGSFGHDFDLDKVEHVATAEEAKARRVPTHREVQDLAMGLCGQDGDGFTIDEAERDGETDVLLHGQTTLGLRLGIRLRIVSVGKEDF